MGRDPRGDHPNWSEKDLQERLGELHTRKLELKAELEDTQRIADTDPTQARHIIPLQKALAATEEEIEKINNILGERDLMVE